MKKKTLCVSLASLFFASVSWAQDGLSESVGSDKTEKITSSVVMDDNHASTESIWSKISSKIGDKPLASKPKFGGYIIGNYSANMGDKEDNTFNIRLLRLYVDGTVLNDFTYRIQVEMSGAPGVDKGPRLLDAAIEWKKYPEFKVKAGQFKRAFTFENPFNPWNVGFGTYSQAITKLAGMSDRIGEHSSGGRDIGLQIQGDLFPSTKDGHRFFHYQVGVYNGQGINHNDANPNKDLIGGIYVMPVKDLKIGAFGWTGSYTNSSLGLKVHRNRMAYGFDYESDWVARAEYISSVGRKADTAEKYNNDGDKADAWYATVGAPVAKTVKLYGKWDVYRDDKTNDNKNSIYSLALNWKPYKDLMFQLTYAYNHNVTPAKETNYSQIMAQFYIRY